MCTYYEFQGLVQDFTCINLVFKAALEGSIAIALLQYKNPGTKKLNNLPMVTLVVGINSEKQYYRLLPASLYLLLFLKWEEINEYFLEAVPTLLQVFTCSAFQTGHFGRTF